MNDCALSETPCRGESRSAESRRVEGGVFCCPGADVVESVEVVGRTPHEGLPQAARARLGTRSGQVNHLLRTVLRPIGRTLTSEQANAIYQAVHEGPVVELI